MTQKELRNIVLKKLYDFRTKENNRPELSIESFKDDGIEMTEKELQDICSDLSELGLVDYIPTLGGIGAIKIKVYGVDYVEQNLLS